MLSGRVFYRMSCSVGAPSIFLTVGRGVGFEEWLAAFEAVLAGGPVLRVSG